MHKFTSLPIDLKSRLGQIFPYALFGAIVFAGVSSANIDRFFSAYLILFILQVGTLGIYLSLRQLKSRSSKNTQL